MKSHHSQLSTNSSSSWDSGVYELDEEYSHVITENSDPEKVKQVDSEFIPKDDLGMKIILNMYFFRFFELINIFSYTTVY